ncbi:MAG: hypothetical protein ACR2QG_06640, partial [Gammaproteobacteria bacterium]
GAEAQGGIEIWIDALKLKSRMIRKALENPEADLDLEAFKGLCAFMSSVRRRIGPWLEQPEYARITSAVRGLVDGQEDTTTTDARIAAFCAEFPNDKKHRWVHDLAAELLHGLDPERYPLMNRWVWDTNANTGVIREIWYGDDVDQITLKVPGGLETFLVLREELSQFLTDNGVFRDVIWYVDLLCAQVYSGYVCAQGGIYLRADFSTPHDPMEHTRRMLGLDGVRAGSRRTRLKAIDGESHVLEESAYENPLAGQ